MNASSTCAFGAIVLVVSLAMAACDGRPPTNEPDDAFEGLNIRRPPDTHLLTDVRDDIRARVYQINRRWHPHSLHNPIQDDLGSDISGLYIMFEHCASENCHLALASENQPHLFRVVHELCRTSLFGPFPSPGSMHLYFYVDASRHAAAREAILPCRQHVVIVDRPSKRTLEVLGPDS